MDPRVISHVESKIATTKIFVVSKIKCPACIQAKALLNKLVVGTGVTPLVFEIDNYPKQYAKEIMKYVSSQTGVKTVPQIWINGKFVGGNDDIQRLHREGRLVFLFGVKTKRRGSSLSTNWLSPMVRISPIKTEVFPKPITETLPVKTIPMFRTQKDHIGNNTWNRRSTFARRGLLSYRPSTNAMGEDMPMRNLKTQNKSTVLQPPSRPCANAFSYSGHKLPSSSTKVSSRGSLWQSSAQRSALPRVEDAKMRKSCWLSDDAIIRRPSVLVQASGSRRKGEIKDVIIASWV